MVAWAEQYKHCLNTKQNFSAITAAPLQLAGPSAAAGAGKQPQGQGVLQTTPANRAPAP